MKTPSWLTVEMLNKMLAEGEENPSRKDYLKIVKRCNRWYTGNSSIVPMEDFDDMTVDEGQAVARINKIRQTIDKQNSILLKNDPIVRTWPLLEGDAELADQMDAMRMQAWEETHGQQVFKSMLQEAQITGLSNCKIYWNPLNIYSNKMGQIAIEKLPPESLIYDPQASNMHRAQDCRYIIHHTAPPLWWFLELYKEEGEAAWGLRDAKGRKAKNFIKQIEGKIKNYAAKIRNRDEIEFPDVYEFWIWPHTMYASELVSGDEIKPNEFPYGLVVTMTNDKILESKLMANPFVKRMKTESQDEYGYPKSETKEVGHKRHPFVPIWWNRKVDNRNTGKYGIYDCSGAVEPMISLQFNVNATRRNIAINNRSLANPSLIVNPDAIVNPIDTIHFANGQILELQNNYLAEQAVKVLQGTQLPSQVVEMLINDISEIEKAGGLEPGVVGLEPGGTSHTPAMTIGALQEAAFGPLWTYVREISDALLDISVLYDGLIQQKYPPDRYLTVSRTGDKFYVDWTDRHITASFKRRIVNGSTTPLFDVEKDQRMANVANIAMQAAISGQPIIIQLAIAQIEALNYPWAYQFIEILKNHLEELTQMNQGMQVLGAMDLSSQQQMQGQEQAALPEGEEEPDYSGIEDLGNELGIPAEQLVAALES